MVAIIPGTKAPFFTLKTSEGGILKLSESLRGHGAVVLAFFKVSCPVCQFTFPYLERLHRSYLHIPVWGISQDDSDATTAFARMYGCSFPMLLDERLDCTVSYGLTNVPSVFLVTQDGAIKQTIVGFAKGEMEDLNEQVALFAQQTVRPLFTQADEVPALKPG